MEVPAEVRAGIQQAQEVSDLLYLSDFTGAVFERQRSEIALRQLFRRESGPAVLTAM